jgi:acyl carrier protein phosphodiesterase
MNYLAHAFLAQPNIYSLTGNLLGDFCKGIIIGQLHPAIQAGLHNHRATDRFTDHHPMVKEARQLFSAGRKRFAGVALDVLFDHYLIQHWHRYSDIPFSEYKANLYRHLDLALTLMPADMAKTISSLLRHDWLQSYQQLSNVSKVLDRIASTIRFEHHFYGIGDEIAFHYSQLEQVFLCFFPQLQQHILQLNLEAPDSSTNIK